MKATPIKRSYFYRNGLTIVFLLLFIVTLGGQALTGWKQHNQDLKEAKAPESKPVDAPHLKTGK